MIASRNAFELLEYNNISLAKTQRRKERKIKNGAGGFRLRRLLCAFAA